MSELPSESNWPAVAEAITAQLRQVEQDRDEQRRIKDEAFDRLAQVIRERGVFFDLWTKTEAEVDTYKMVLDLLLPTLIPEDQRRCYGDLPGWAEQAIRERDEARAALKKVRAVIWNWGGPANRNEAGEWVVMKQFETAMVDAIAAVLDAPEPQEDRT